MREFSNVGMRRRIRQPRSRYRGYRSFRLSGLPSVAMSLGCKILVAALLFVGHSAPVGESQVNGFPADADFFPIGVWLQSPTRADSYKAIGINTFVGLYEGPTEQQLAALAQKHMFAVVAQNDVGLKSVNRHVIKAW